MRRLELVGGALERRVRGAVRRTLERRVGDAPVHELRVRRELRAHLADAVAQRDHLVEALGDELVEVLGAVRADVDATRPQHADRVRVQRLRVAAGAAGLDRAGRHVLDAAPRRSGSGRCSRCTGTTPVADDADRPRRGPSGRRARHAAPDGAHRPRSAAPRGRRRGRSRSSCRDGPPSSGGRTPGRRRGAGASGTTPGSAVRRPASSTPPRPDRCAPAPAAAANAPDATPAARTAAALGKGHGQWRARPHTPDT